MIEKFGIAFTYMGPPEKEPLFPYFSILEELDEGESLLAGGGSKPVSETPIVAEGQMDFNWLQNYENFMDPLHLTTLHSSLNGMQFNEYISSNPIPAKIQNFRQG